jgi:cytokinin dehydrogenase
MSSEDGPFAAGQRDFGGLYRHCPREIVRARSEQDVSEAVGRARRLGVPAVARGQGHSTGGQSLSAGGISIVTTELDRIRIEGDTAVVGGGARWRSVVRAAWAHGLMPPVLTDYLGLSVGGTLSVGGVGGASFRQGTQTDQVVELRVVTGRGDVRSCSPDREPELFDACRAGLGHVGVIVEARLRLVAAPERVRVTRLAFDALEPFLEEQLRLAEEGGVDELRGSILPASVRHRFVIEAAQYVGASSASAIRSRGESLAVSEHGFFDYADRLSALEQHMRVTGLWQAHHPWFDVFVPGSCAAELIELALRELVARQLVSSHVMMYPLRRGPSRTPLLSIPADPHAFLFDVLPDEQAAAALPAWRAFAANVYDRAVSCGGRMYPIGYPMGTADVDFCSHYGASWAQVEAARRAHDPDGIFSRHLGARTPHQSTTLGELAASQLAALGRASGGVGKASYLTELAETLSNGWWTQPIAGGPAWPSDLTDDGTPFELSIQTEDAFPELRLLVEPRPLQGGAIASFHAALSLADVLAARYGADASSLHEVASLFAPPPGSSPRFLIWYGVHITPTGPLFKAYLNPEVHGPSQARELLRGAFERLGFRDAFEQVAEQVARSTRAPYFSVDLCAKEQARVKVYLAHAAAPEDGVERAAAGGKYYRPGQLRRRLQALLSEGSSSHARPVLTCHAFRRDGGTPEVTLHVPIRCHVADDREALAVAQTFGSNGAAEALIRVVSALARRPLDSGRGMMTYLSLREGRWGGTRVTAYLAPQAYELTPVRERAYARVGDIRRAVELAQARYAAQPFFARMERGGSSDDVRQVAHRLAFFVMCFQDMARIACERCTDPVVAAALRQHQQEDMGHECWFLADLTRLELSRDLGDIFRPTQTAVRDAGYSIVSLLLQARYDTTRLAIVLAVEGAGQEFFGRFVAMAQRSSVGQGLVFFGGLHQRAEAEHQFATCAELFERPVGAAEICEMSDAVHATFREMTRIAHDMEVALGTPKASQVAARVSAAAGVARLPSP